MRKQLALFTAAVLACAAPALAAPIPDKYSVTVEILPTDAPPATYKINCKRAEPCHDMLKVPFPAGPKPALFSARVRERDIIDISFASTTMSFPDPRVREVWENGATWETDLLDYQQRKPMGLDEVKRGKVRFSVSN